jgi:maleamate amidohydrolase
MDESEIYRRQNFGNSSGFGARPALLIVDFVNGFADPGNFGGGNIADAIAGTVKLLAACRRLRLPIASTRVVYPDDATAEEWVFARKAPGLLNLTESVPASQIVAELAPLPGEYIVRKRMASAFFATDLANWLIARQVDTVLVTGCTTSGCVRASALDAMQHNFRTIVVRDCVGDRALGPHEASLFDLAQKYADVLMLDEVLAKLEPLPAAG